VTDVHTLDISNYSSSDGVLVITPVFAPPPVVAAGTTFSATEGMGFTGQTVATFTADRSAPASQYTATIDWGNGSSPTIGTITGDGSGKFTVSGAHTYAEEHGYTLSVTVTDTTDSSNTDMAISTANVGDAALTAGTLTLHGGTEGVSAGSASFGFTDANPGATTADFSATIDWGDGHTSSGTLTGPTGGPFTLAGGHQYTEEGDYTVSVTVTDDGGSMATASDTNTVGDASITASCSTPTVSPQSFTGTVASLSDDNTGAPASDFTGTIDWGDGSSTSNGTVAGSGGSYTITGGHSYGSTGYYNITATVTDDGGSDSMTSACKMLVFAFAASGGAFAIGNGNSTNGTAVTYWGAKWWKLNTLTGGSAPAASKGYPLSPKVPTCGTGWSTGPGNSAPPPTEPLPAYMGVIVTSAASKSGSQISGDTPHIAIIKKDPGYAPSPGHPGTGTVVRQVC
jgi:hypothetical protein